MYLIPENLPRTQSSLLIPRRYLKDFEERSAKSGREKYFHSLLKKFNYLIMSGGLGKRNSLKKKYQDPGSDLVKKNFKPLNEDWIKFDALSDYLGLSKTGLFTLLLLLDIAGWDELLCEKWYTRGVPPHITFFSSRLSMIHGNPSQIVRKIYFRIKI